ncbi:helix-turn-helix transcriptional regulator [Pseudomonas sp. UBA1879]|uniref:helix-turn-helix transcriptional regulator n=1 Tax=Pseudomonas sp. UBA1879 TaxID=1947305 RepID=UPI0025FE2BA4|nr:helix-turn-helix transcriptional regulator [Pseudomonas sp. UBA1879]
MKTTLLDQIRKQRLALGLKIQDMTLRAGLTRQQYGKIEAGGNPRLDTLDQIAEGLDAVLILVPKSKLNRVEKVLASEVVEDIEPLYPNLDRLSAEQRSPVLHDDESPWGDI